MNSTEIFETYEHSMSDSEAFEVFENNGVDYEDVRNTLNETVAEQYSQWIYQHIK